MLDSLLADEVKIAGKRDGIQYKDVENTTERHVTNEKFKEKKKEKKKGHVN